MALWPPADPIHLLNALGLGFFVAWAVYWAAVFGTSAWQFHRRLLPEAWPWGWMHFPGWVRYKLDWMACLRLGAKFQVAVQVTFVVGYVFLVGAAEVIA